MKKRDFLFHFGNVLTCLYAYKDQMSLPELKLLAEYYYYFAHFRFGVSKEDLEELACVEFFYDLIIQKYS